MRKGEDEKIEDTMVRNQRGRAATKQAFYPQISQITRIVKIMNKNNSKDISFRNLLNKI